MKLHGGVGGGGVAEPVGATSVGDGEEEGGDGELEDMLDGGEGDSRPRTDGGPLQKNTRIIKKI